MKDALAQQVQLGSAITLSLDELHPTDLAFTLGSTPGQRQSVPYSFQVVSHAFGAGLEGFQI